MVDTTLGTKSDQLIDFGIVCALPLERDALCRALGFRDEHRQSQGRLTFFVGSLNLGGQRQLRVALAMARKMGQLEAYDVTGQLLRHLCPAAILFAGIAGALKKKEVRLGDIVLGESTYYYPSGKLRKGTMLPAPEMLPANRWLLSRAQNLPTWNPELPRKPGRREDQAKPTVHSGVIASGEMVIADEAFRAKLTKAHTHMLAVEMEGHAFYRAAWDREPPVPALVIRAISDDASKQKAVGRLKDQWQQWAAASAAAFVLHFLRDCSQLQATNASITTLITPTASKVSRQSLLDIIVGIVEPQFEAILFRLEGEGLKRSILPSSSSSQQIRAIELMRWVESPDGCGLDTLKAVIARESPRVFRPRPEQ